MAADPELIKATQTMSSTFVAAFVKYFLPVFIFFEVLDLLIDVAKNRHRRGSATVYRTDDRYLHRTQYKLNVQGLLWRIISLIAFGVFFIFLLTFAKAGFLAGLLVVLIVMIFVTNRLAGKFRTYERRADAYYRGNAGEKIVTQTLSNLPDEYNIFWDYQVSKDRGNIDFVVTGPTGLFTIEVKSHRNGAVGFDGKDLTWNGRQFEKEFLRQAKGEAFELNRYLQEKLQKNYYVQPIIVFVNYVKIHFGKKPVDGVLVIGKEWLNQVISEGQRHLSQEEIAKIVAVMPTN